MGGVGAIGHGGVRPVPAVGAAPAASRHGSDRRA
jgi:hypothetical protein